MNPTTHAIKVGVKRGWIATVLSIKSVQDQVFYIVMALGLLVYMFWNRNADMGDAGISFPQYALPSLLAGVIAFSLVMGPTYEIAMEKEDGTLLRAKSLPRGMLSYTVGQVVFNALGLVPALVVILVPSFILFDGVAPETAVGWLRIGLFLVVGLIALLPIGIVVGSLVPSVQKAGTWGMLPIIVLSSISGVFFPIQELWGWVQGIAQVFPIYWLGLGLRSGFLPDEFAVLELHDAWMTLPAIGVLTAWAIAGILLAPKVLARMAQRQSGSAMQEAKENAAQWVK